MNNKSGSLEDVRAVLAEVLQIDDLSRLGADARLLGGLPEFDSLAVATVVIGLEEHFDLVFDDEDISAEIFETIGTLAAFVDSKKPVVVDAADPIQASFLAATSGNLFVIRFDPKDNNERRCVVFVAPFAEEMNRVRHLMTATALSLNKVGLSVCCFDFHGTGDSVGEFSDARWSHWLKDLEEVVADLRRQGFQTIDLIGIRLGALLALEFANNFKNQVTRLVFWDPVFDGNNYLDRFLRTRSMAAMMTGKTESVKELRSRLDAGQNVEVGGYDLHPELAAAIARVAPTQRRELAATSLHWIDRDELVDGQNIAATMGLRLNEVIRSTHDPYWASVETTTAPTLIEATRQCLTGKQ